MTGISMPVPEWGGFADQAPDFGSGEWAPKVRSAHRGGRKLSGRVRKPNRRPGAVVAVVALAYGFGALFTAIGTVVR